MARYYTLQSTTRARFFLFDSVTRPEIVPPMLRAGLTVRPWMRIMPTQMRIQSTIWERVIMVGLELVYGDCCIL